MDAVLSFLNNEAVLVMVGVITGIAVKYLPWLGKLPNAVIPYLNALIVFLSHFAATPAEASVFGTALGQLTVIGQFALAAAVSTASSLIYETFIRHPLEKLGVKKFVPTPKAQ